ncbi:MAG: helix-turn-helix domain-containing protein, partial [Alphaproteobacteria bacterium]|nr:helix-turn-helix domain-containing protein [Alphaproteobacteria bacterium]
MTMIEKNPTPEDGLAKTKSRLRSTAAGASSLADSTAEAEFSAALTVGEALKKVRTQQKVQLRTISDSLRIRLEYLEAIENGHFKKLPGTTYGIGFVRSYAEYLGLEAQPYIDKFKLENNQPIGGSTKVSQSSSINLAEIFQSIDRKVIIVVVIIAAGLLGWLFFSGGEQSATRVNEVPSKMTDSLANTPEGATPPPVTPLAIVPTDRTKAAGVTTAPPTLPPATVVSPSAPTPAPQAGVKTPTRVPAAPAAKPIDPPPIKTANPAPLFKPRSAETPPAISPAPAKPAAPAAQAPAVQTPAAQNKATPPAVVGVPPARPVTPVAPVAPAAPVAPMSLKPPAGPPGSVTLLATDKP